jgi:tetratricopeptide (TPR) repeat protein
MISPMKRILSIVVCIAVFFGLMAVRPYLRLTDNIQRGDSLAAQGEYDKAFYAYGDALHRFPDNPLPYFRRAIAMQNAGKHTKAQVDLGDVIRLRPNFGPAYRLRAESLRAQGLQDKAKQDDARADELKTGKDLAALRELKTVDESNDGTKVKP